jgi:WS/DGAT/MGAT family acyltransferase
MPTQVAMSPADAAWLHMDSPENLLVITGLLWTAEPLERSAVHALLADRLVGRFPKFRQHPVAPRTPWDRPHWADDPAFDLDRHLVEHALPAPGGQEELEAFVGTLMAEPFEPGHPPWRLYLVQGYGRGSALIYRLHHAIADGMALSRVMLSLAEDGPAPAEAGFAPTPHRSTLGALAHVGFETLTHPSRLAAMAGTVTRDAGRLLHIAGLPVKTDSAVAGQPGTAKLATWSAPIPLEDVRGVAKATGTTVNDVLLSVLAGGLSRYLEGRATPLPTARVLVPVDLRAPDQPLPADLGNHFGFYFVDLPTGHLAPQDRLARLHEHVAGLKDSPEAFVSWLVLAGLGLAPQLVEDFGVGFFGSKVVAVVTNVPGPRTPIRMAGTRVDGVVVWVPRGGDIDLGVAIFSYAGTVTVGFAADAAVIPDPSALVSGFEAELDALRAAVLG